MNPGSKVALLGEAPAGCHLCQFDCDSDPLSASVAVFAAAGLRCGDAVILVASPERSAAVLALLEADSLDTRAARASGQLQVMSAPDKVTECSQAAQPDLECLKRAIDGLVDGVPAQWRKHIRLYGEIVNELWHRGHAELAIRLEDHWNELLRIHPLSLFCGYALDGLAESTYAGPFSEIGRTHTGILPTSDDERFRAAVDAATEDVLGIAFSLILSCSAREQTLGEHRLPIGWRTLLWLHRNMPVTSGHILERTRHYLEQAGKPDAAAAG